MGPTFRVFFFFQKTDPAFTKHSVYLHLCILQSSPTLKNDLSWFIKIDHVYRMNCILRTRLIMWSTIFSEVLLLLNLCLWENKLFQSQKWLRSDLELALSFSFFVTRLEKSTHLAMKSAKGSEKDYIDHSIVWRFMKGPLNRCWVTM